VKMYARLAAKRGIARLRGMRVCGPAAGIVACHRGHREAGVHPGARKKRPYPA
jgi:hypothetical protein